MHGASSSSHAGAVIQHPRNWSGFVNLTEMKCSGFVNLKKKNERNK
jgi:hypothetical protein